MKTKSSVLSLIFVNMIPIFGVIFWNWNLAAILIMYWSENIVIGFYNVLKMAKAEMPNQTGIISTLNGRATTDYSKIGLMGFFIIHYGLFTAIHGGIVFAIFIKNADINFSLLTAIIFLFVSHGTSYLNNYIGTGEYKKLAPENLMFSPYKRVIIMHMTIIFGSMLAVKIQGQPIGPLIILVLIKTVVDFFSHNFEHNQIFTLNNKSGTKVIHINPSLIRKIFPNYEKFVQQAFEQSIKSGKWQEIKKQIDPKTAKEIEEYWEKNNKQIQ